MEIVSLSLSLTLSLSLSFNLGFLGSLLAACECCDAMSDVELRSPHPQHFERQAGGRASLASTFKLSCIVGYGLARQTPERRRVAEVSHNKN